MTESIFDRLARKIELAKARAEREQHEGDLHKRPGGWSYEPPDPTVPVAAPVAAPVAPATPKAGGNIKVFFETRTLQPPRAGAYPVASVNPAKYPDTIIYDGANASYWDGCHWHGTPDPGSLLTALQGSVWWTYP